MFVHFLTADVFRFISQDTIEEGIYTVAQDKLKLEQEYMSKMVSNGTVKGMGK